MIEPDWVVPYDTAEEFEENDWLMLEKYRSKVIRIDHHQKINIEKFNKYPGFLIDDINIKHLYLYQAGIYRKYLRLNFYSLPRGNLTFDNKIIVLGFAPGWNTIRRQESHWLLGPSSKILQKLLNDLKIYPYYTNLFKKALIYNKEYSYELKDAQIDLLDELMLLKRYFKFDKILVLGKYKEYDVVLNKIKKLYNIIQIWHPSYIVRNNYKNYNEWLEQASIIKKR